MYVSENSQQGEMKYVYTDHLGSITAVASETGTILARINFDAWGSRRHAIDYSYLQNNTVTVHNGLDVLNSTNNNLPPWLYRGYTGHEQSEAFSLIPLKNKTHHQKMLDEFTLINMNARLYDPVVGMMLSCDNYVSDATNTQDYHRYCYARNNPLKYTDPDGNEPVTMAIAATLGTVFGGVAGYKIGVARGATGGDLFAYTMAGAGIGAGAAVTGAWIGAAAAGGGMTAIAASALGGASAGAVSGAGFYTLGNAGTKNFSGEGLISASLRGAHVGAVGGFAGTIVGGGLGAFVGGATGSIYNDVLNNRDVNWTNALLSGTVSLGVYSYGMYQSWKASSGNIGGDSYEFGSYYRMQGALQRYETFGKSFEIGANVYNGSNGLKKFGTVKYGNPFGRASVNLPDDHGIAIGDFHTHTSRGIGFSYHGKGDFQALVKEGHGASYYSKVLGSDGNVYRITGKDAIYAKPILDNHFGYKNYFTPECLNDWNSFMNINNFNTPVSNVHVQPFFNYFNK